MRLFSKKQIVRHFPTGKMPTSKKQAHQQELRRKQVPQGYWENIGIVLVNGPTQVRLKPTGIKKGKKLCVEVPVGVYSTQQDIVDWRGIASCCLWNQN